MEMISDLLARYKSDKVNPHTYGAAYDSIFAELDREAPLNILEIGIQKGGSLCAWHDYLPNARITGIDIVDTVAPEYRREGINYVFCDVNDFTTDELFDLVIDDGSHWLKDVVHSVAYFSRKLKVGGIMIVEDVQNADIWYKTIATIIHPVLAYNEGYKWTLSRYDATGDGLEDNFLFAIQREQ